MLIPCSYNFSSGTLASGKTSMVPTMGKTRTVLFDDEDPFLDALVRNGGELRNLTKQTRISGAARKINLCFRSNKLF